MANEILAGYSLAHNHDPKVTNVTNIKSATNYPTDCDDPFNAYDIEVCRLQIVYEASFRFYFRDPAPPKSLFLEYQHTVNAIRTLAYLGLFAVDMGNCLRVNYKTHMDVFSQCGKGEFLSDKQCIPALAHALSQRTLYGNLFWSALPSASYYHEIRKALTTLLVNRGVYVVGLMPLGKMLLQELCG